MKQGRGQTTGEVQCSDSVDFSGDWNGMRPLTTVPPVFPQRLYCRISGGRKPRKKVDIPGSIKIGGGSMFSCLLIFM